MEIENEIKQILRKIRPYLQQDGGDLEFIKFENGIVYIKLLGACQGCMYSDDTIKGAIEAILLEEVQGILGVQAIEMEE